MPDIQLTPPTTKRSYANSWSELDYLCKKISYWLYARGQKTKAERYLQRLEKVLEELRDNDSAILRHEGLALLHELQGESDKAIRHREREIQMMEGLHREAQSPQLDDSTKAYMLQDRDSAALETRRALLTDLKKAKSQPGRLLIRTA